MAVTFQNINADTAPFAAGYYGISGTAASWGSGGSTGAQLELLGPDGQTWLAAMPLIIANGISTVYLMAGQYRINIIGTLNAVYLTISKIAF